MYRVRPWPTLLLCQLPNPSTPGLPTPGIHVYQSSRVGCINHARRQQRYRERQRQDKQQQERLPEPKKIVTQQGSHQPSAGDLLVPEMALSVIKDQASAPVSLLYCHWCTRAVSGVRRTGWLRYAVQDEPDHSLNGEPRGQSP